MKADQSDGCHDSALGFALNTFREAVRTSVLHLVSGAAAVILSIILEDITIGDQ